MPTSAKFSENLNLQQFKPSRSSEVVYLGSLLSSDGYCRPDINRRIGLASSVVSALHDIWKDRYLSISTKIRMALKMLDAKMTDVKLTDQFAGHEIAGHEIDGPMYRT